MDAGAITGRPFGESAHWMSWAPVCKPRTGQCHKCQCRVGIVDRMAAQASGTMLEPDAVAEGFAYLHSQPRNCWTFEMDMRPHNFTAWYHTDGASGAPPVSAEERLARLRQ